MLSKHIPNLVALSIAVACLALAYWQLAPLFSQQSADTNSTPGDLPATPAMSSQKKTYYSIEQFALFGDASAPQPKRTVQKDLPKTNLRLTLTGIVANTDQNDDADTLFASALIEGPDRQTNYYKVGDKVPGNATVDQILADRVVIERAGKLENLFFSETSSPLIAAVDRAPNAFSNDQYPEDYEDEYEGLSNLPRQNRGFGSAPPLTTPTEFTEAQKQTIKDRLANLRKRVQQSTQ